MESSKHLSTAQVIAIGFALIILVGTLLLMLPVASADGESLAFSDALFTSCSAACVTGLVVRDTATQFSGFGQAVILLLIETGGLGFMTLAIVFPLLFGRRIGLRERINLTEAVGAPQIGGVVRLTRRILLGTLLLETAGAAVLSWRFIPVFGVGRGIWYGVFHSVPAFCNAGFDLMGSLQPFSSLTHFAGDAAINLTVMALIFIGGVGFIVWNDVAHNGPHFRRYALHTKLVLTFSAGTVFISAALFLVTERGAAFAGMGGGERILAALFAAVTPRTAGFNTVAVSSLSESGTILTALLMIVGAGSGSTGGGVKISTAAVLILMAYAYIRHRQNVNAFGRRVDGGSIRKAFCSVLVYLTSAVVGCFLITVLEELPVKEALFECLSAIGTVGLSMGITPGLSFASRCVIILLMYLGRVGSLTVFMAVMEPRNGAAEARFPAEKVMIG